MGNATSRNDHFPVPPGFMPPVYPGYPQFATPTTWNPFKRSAMKKRQKALREYLYTTPMILQYPGAFAVTQPGQTLVHPAVPQVHAAIPIAPVSANGTTNQMTVPVPGAPMVVTAASAPTDQGGGGAGGAAAAAPVVQPQMMAINYPTFDYSAFLDPRGATDPVVPRRSRRSQRHRSHNHHHHNRQRSRSPTPSEESGANESDYSNRSYDSGDYPRHHRHHRSNSAHNPLPRPPKDILSSTPFRPLLTQLPSAQFNSWGIGGARTAPPQQHQPPPPAPTTYGNVRPRRQRRGLFTRGEGVNFPVPSLGAAANTIARPFMQGPTMSMPEPQVVQQPHPGSAPAGAAHMPPVIPQMISPQPQIRMPSPETGPPAQQGRPVIPGTTVPMPSPGPAGSTPFIGPIGPGGFSTPRSMVVPPSGQMMPSPSSGHVPMSMPSPAVVPAVVPPGGFTQPTTPMAAGAVIPPPGSVLVTSAMAMPSPSLGAGAAMPSQILKFNGYGEYAGLLYHSPDNVLYQDELYPTALHLFEARKFLDHRPDLAERIRQCERVEEVTAISAELAEFTRRDWGIIALTTMDEVLYLKFRQHGNLRALLLDTYPAELLYAESGDAFWGDGAGTGLNELGKSLMRVRGQLRQEAGI